MRRITHISAFVAIALGIGGAVFAQEVRLANGILVKGTVGAASAEGLEIKTAAGAKTYTWETLSAGTRFRYDPDFRANYDVILRGLPPFARTNIPAGQAAAEVAPAAEAPKVEEAPAAKGGEGESLIIFDQADYENVDPLYSSKFPPVSFRAPELATFIGFQYGPRRTDVLYLACDAKDADDLSDVLYAYSPGSPDYKQPVRMTGFKKGSGSDRFINFKKFKLSTTFGDVAINYDFDCETSGTMTNVLKATITVEFVHKDTKSRFLLFSEFSDLLKGEGLINVKGIVDIPVLWVSLDMSTGSPRLVGNLNMSNMKLIPKDGMDTRVALVVNDEAGAAVERYAIKLDAAILTDPYLLVQDLRKVDGGKTYSVEASLDMGPFLGPMSFDDKFTVPATKK